MFSVDTAVRSFCLYGWVVMMTPGMSLCFDVLGSLGGILWTS